MKNKILNKSFITNFISFIIIIIGYYLPTPYKEHIFPIGLFSFSGAITNWLAIYMLFEKIPGLYGSGVIPSRFEDFKKGIFSLIMDQFFTHENLKRFIEDKGKRKINFEPVIDNLNMDPLFNSLKDTVKQSNFGNMLTMFGGTSVIDPLKEAFLKNIKKPLIDFTNSNEFQDNVLTMLDREFNSDEFKNKIEDIVKKRLNELTPIMVKEIIQHMIRKHLGWLVVWGGVFGGIIGFITSFI